MSIHLIFQFLRRRFEQVHRQNNFLFFILVLQSDEIGFVSCILASWLDLPFSCNWMWLRLEKLESLIKSTIAHLTSFVRCKFTLFHQMLLLFYIAIVCCCVWLVSARKCRNDWQNSINKYSSIWIILRFQRQRSFLSSVHDKFKLQQLFRENTTILVCSWFCFVQRANEVQHHMNWCLKVTSFPFRW